MRVAFVGASTLAVIAAKALVERGHEVVVIDADPACIEDLADQLDCGLIEGDGSRPGVLREIGPEQTDFLICLSDRDEANILAALVGRSLGFDRVVPKVEDPDLETICAELGLDDVIVPDRDVADVLVDLVEGRANASLMTVVQEGLRFTSLCVPEGVSDPAGLDLPSGARAIAVNRDDRSRLVDDDTRLEAGDRVVVIAEEDVLGELEERFAENGDGGGRTEKKGRGPTPGTGVG